MTQEEKDLLLKDLCARLPYGVKFQSENIETALFVDTSDGEVWINGTCIVDFKPYLFPLSSMTLEQRCKVQSLLSDKCNISFTNSKFEFYGEDYNDIKLEQFEKIFNLFNMLFL